MYEQKHAIKNDFTIGEYFIDEQKYQEMLDFSLKANDLIISCSGTMGKIAIVPENFKPGIINQALLRLAPKPGIILPEFLKVVLEDDMIQDVYFRNTAGAAIQNVASVKALKSIQIPLPPLKVQEKIIAQIEEEQKLVEMNKKLIEIFERKIKEKVNEVWGQS